jgi:hypothetical protein
MPGIEGLLHKVQAPAAPQDCHRQHGTQAKVSQRLQRAKTQTGDTNVKKIQNEVNPWKAIPIHCCYNVYRISTDLFIRRKNLAEIYCKHTVTVSINANDWNYFCYPGTVYTL